MDLEERVQRLERRLHELEDLVEDLQAAGGGVPAPVPSTPAVVLAHPPAKPREPPPAPPAVSTAVVNQAPGVEVGSEEWIGRWGLLATGVVLVVLAAGYFVKLAIDRGWISPLMRCSSGAVLGAALAYAGWRLHERGLRSYGAALMGCGAAVAYVAVWAAVRWYDLLPPTVGLGLVALLSVGVFAAARSIDIEALGAAAALGAFAAPAMLGAGGNPDLLLLYSAFLAAGLGWVAERRWRLTTFLIGLSFFVIGRAAPAAPASVLMYSVVGSSAALYVGLREGWPELRALSFAGGWLLLGIAAGRMGAGPHPLVGAGAIVLAAPIWWRGLRHASIWPAANPSGPESLYFYLTPGLLAWGLRQFAPLFLGAHGWVVWLVVAIPYLAAGYSKPRVPFATVGAAALIVGLLQAWSGPGAVWALLALAMVWAGLDHVLTRTDGRWYALAAFAVGLVHLLGWDLPQRGPGPAFLDSWALAFWGTTLLAAMLAAGLWRRVESPPPERPRDAAPFLRQSRTLDDLLPFARQAFWVAAGAMVFSAVSGELIRFFHRAELSPATAELAGGLSVSAWWAFFAAGLVVLGFWSGLKQARVAGLLVSGLAILKVIFRDLSQLSAMYRVASVLTLGLVSLAVAYLYHRYTAGHTRTAQRAA